ncbi:MAG: helix-turn-helix domain-containing protein [Pyrinomonadaceae bacterium]
MSDLQKYITQRKKTDKEFEVNYDECFENFKIGVMLRQVRESEGLTQEEIARKLNTKKSAISCIENHAEDICLSTLRKYAEALGKESDLKSPDMFYPNQ